MPVTTNTHKSSIGETKTEKMLLSRALASPRVTEAQLGRHLDRMPYFRVVEGASSATIRVEGKSMLNLASNNYLGLATDARVVRAAQDALGVWGAGVTGSRFMNGNLELHLQLEEELSDFYGREASLVFPTGYTANLGLLSALTKSGDEVVVDEEIHASLHDSARLSGAKLSTFTHNDATACRTAVRDVAAGMCVIEGVYSMSGDIAPVGEMVTACSDSTAMLVVDEAHGLGVLGPGGRGAVELAGMSDAVDVLTVTFSKSLGGCGGAILGSSSLIDAIRYSARPFMFTASNTPASVASALAALRILREHPEYAAEVCEGAAALSATLRASGVAHKYSGGAIISIVVGSDIRTAQAWKMLWNRDVFCNASVSPAVERGKGALRLSVMRTHSPADIARAASTCAEVLTELDALSRAGGA